MLAVYGLRICEEWVARGYNDNMTQRFIQLLREQNFNDTVPSWLGDEEFHRSHRSNLLRKDSEYYGQFDWNESPDLEYVWPV